MDVDAIIVPTARGTAYLEPTIKLAGELGTTLVALCSKWSSAGEVAALAAREGVKLIAVDVDDLPAGVVPSFQTRELLAGTRLARGTDTSLKRNFGLLLARLLGWERIVFLDDDIKVPEPADLRAAAGLTRHYAGVGLVTDEMPDNSVVCHAFREAGGAQDVFVGGGALAVGAAAMTSFFPDIYNDDWFFLLDDDGLRPVTITGRVIQKTYDPFLEHRARTEEFGDSLAEGLFWLLDNGRSLRDATAGHWRTFLRDRAEFITDVMGMVERMPDDPDDPDRRRRMLLSLKAARGRCQYIDAELCVRYLQAWHADRAGWRRHVEDLQRRLVPRKRTRRERRSLHGVREMFRALDFRDRAARLHLPLERLHHDAADLDVPLPVAVSQ